MLYGLDDQGNRVCISDAAPQQTYSCPLCGGALIQRHGSHRVEHFAHKSTDECDTWSSDMSDWHRSWQMQYPEECREVVIEKGGVKHRADICLHSTIVEFQSSPITPSEYDERNRFYNEAGYKVVWLFNCIDKAGLADDDEANHYTWKYAPPTFDNFSANSRKVEVYFQFNEPSEKAFYISKVVWVSHSGIKKFIVHDNWLNTEEFLAETRGEPLPVLWDRFFNIDAGIFVNQYNGATFLVNKSPDLMAKFGEVRGVRSDGTGPKSEQSIYYWNQPQWKANTIYFLE